MLRSAAHALSSWPGEICAAYKSGDCLDLSWPTMLSMNRLFTAFALGAVAAQAQTKPLPKNGGLTDERPTYSSPAEAQYKLVEPKLRTKWTEQPTENPWPEYPRPQLKRDNWLSLNGVWELQEAKANDTDAPFGQTLNQRVLVPYCLESGISGVALQLQNVWYVRLRLV